MENNTTSANEQGEEFAQILRVLYTMKRSENNHELFVEYFLENFQFAPEKLGGFIKVLKSELLNIENIYREKIARRYISIFSFLCERFGYYEEKLILDDLVFQITQPEEYKHLSFELKKYQESSQVIINNIFEVFSSHLSGLSSSISYQGRYKNIFSIYKKCKQKSLETAFQLGDIFAFRIIIDGSEEECYDILEKLHNHFTPLPHRFKDYIAIPKINGYQSLHTSLLGVIPELEIPIEVQIRTQTMDALAEGGVAAHFLYAQTKKSQILGEKGKKLIEHIEHHQENMGQKRFVYCLTPKGELMKFPSGSTIYDFAQKIHSTLPQKTKYALVNNTTKNLGANIENFDSIELITQ